MLIGGRVRSAPRSSPRGGRWCRPAVRISRSCRCIAVEVALHEQHAAQQQRGVDGRQLHPAAVALAGLQVQEVVEEAVVAGVVILAAPLRRVGEETQRGQYARDRLLARDVAALARRCRRRSGRSRRRRCWRTACRATARGPAPGRCRGLLVSQKKSKVRRSRSSSWAATGCRASLAASGAAGGAGMAAHAARQAEGKAGTQRQRRRRLSRSERKHGTCGEGLRGTIMVAMGQRRAASSLHRISLHGNGSRKASCAGIMPTQLSMTWATPSTNRRRSASGSWSTSGW